MKKLLLLFVTLLSANHISAQSSANGYMVDAVWSQGYPYNIFCPSLANGNKALTGCGATAMAQIFYYYQFPLKGTGHVKYGNVDVDLDACAIDWQHIQPRYGAQASETEKEAVANLMRVVGAAMKMHYMTNGSSPYNYPSMMWGLQHYLHLSPQSRYLRRCYYSTAEWMEMLCKELDEGHPVFYRGDHSEPDKSLAGHMFVVDGHDGTSLFHANYGHGEDYQIRWVDLNLLNQGNGTAFINRKQAIARGDHRLRSHAGAFRFRLRPHRSGGGHHLVRGRRPLCQHRRCEKQRICEQCCQVGKFLWGFNRLFCRVLS